MFENRHTRPITRQLFINRLARNIALASVLVLASLLLGMAGYHYIEGLSWVDSYANASMILSGMGPLASMQTTAGKIFAGTYALYSGIALISFASIILAPILHRFLHKFHCQD